MCLFVPTTCLSTFRTLRNRCRLSFRLLAKAVRWLGFMLKFCGRPCSAWDRHPDPTGGQLLDQFENFQHTTHLFEIVAGFQCHPLGAQIAVRVTCDGALRMAAHLPDAGCASAAATTDAIAVTAATGATAATAVGAAAGGCSS